MIQLINIYSNELHADITRVQIILIMFGWLFKMTSVMKRGTKAVGEKSPVNIIFLLEGMNGICGMYMSGGRRE